MRRKDEGLVQAENGLWVPKQFLSKKVQFKRKHQDSQETELEREPSRDWQAYWKAHGIFCRQREPEIDEERQQFLLQRLEIQPDNVQHIYPFKEVILTRADIEWLVEEEERGSSKENEQGKCLKLQGAILNAVDLSLMPLEDANFTAAQLKGANFTSAQLKGACFETAQLEGTIFRGAQLQRAYFWDAQLQRARFDSAQLQEAIFATAQLKGATFEDADLERARFDSAQLQQANFVRAQLKEVAFQRADLERANFTSAQLQGADFREARFANTRGVGPHFADVTGWNEVFLAHIEWSQIKVIGEEAREKKNINREGRVKEKPVRLNEYRVAARTYRQLATALETQGLKEEAERFAYRAQVMQRKLLWWRMRQESLVDHKWRMFTFYRQRGNDLFSYLFSLLLALLAGYGYRFRRSLVSYICILLTFAFLYLHISQGTEHPLEWIDAAILSISDMLGRGFFRQDMTLSDPYASWSVLEGMIGVLMDVLLISTLTQRLFKK